MASPTLDPQLHQFLHWIDTTRPTRLAVVMDRNTERHCLPLVQPLLPPHTDFLCLSDTGEAVKSLEHAHALWSHLDSVGFDRQSAIVALGGGTVTDLAGFVASTYLRGVDFWLIPTTLLGMVDAATGGKTGINLAGGKNRVGTFQTPAGVSLNPEFLRTLPERETRAGLAEHIKHLLLTSASTPTDAELGHWMTDGDGLDLDRAGTTILKSVQIKSSIVAEDAEEQSGIRKLLNLGHTAGHALESWAMSEERDLLHGEAVAWGLRVALAISAERHGDPDSALKQAGHWLASNFPCPVVAPEAEALWPWALQDKKNDGDQVNMVLLHGLGNPVRDQAVSFDEFEAGIRAAESMG